MPWCALTRGSSCREYSNRFGFKKKCSRSRLLRGRVLYAPRKPAPATTLPSLSYASNNEPRFWPESRPKSTVTWTSSIGSVATRRPAIKTVAMRKMLCAVFMTSLSSAGKCDAVDKSGRHDTEEPGRLRVAAHNLGEPMAVRPRVRCRRKLQKTPEDGQECPSYMSSSNPTSSSATIQPRQFGAWQWQRTAASAGQL